jgi:trehalose/maltose transport system substrate-binding protein
MSLMRNKINDLPFGLMAAALGSFLAMGAGALAEEITFASGNASQNEDSFRTIVEPWEKATGHTVKLVPMPPSSSEQFAQYKLWLSAGAAEIDAYQTDVIWAPQLADHFVDLSEAAKDIVPLHFPSIIASQTVNGKLVAMPAWTDAPALFYRKDLLEKYGKTPPKTWAEMTRIAEEIQAAERAAGNTEIWGFVWQGNAYEGLTCNALEWVMSSGGGRVVEDDGSITINNAAAAAAIDLAAGWVDTISPPGVLTYKEEDARGIWQSGNAVFMRNWPYAWKNGNKDDSAVKGLFDVVTLPVATEGMPSAATLGGWNVAVSAYSTRQEAAISFALYMASPEAQKLRAINQSQLPTIPALYEDAEVAGANPIIPRWKDVFLNAVARPSAPTGAKYNETSSLFWSAVHKTLSGDGTAAENLEVLSVDLEALKGGGW